MQTLKPMKVVLLLYIVAATIYTTFTFLLSPLLKMHGQSIQLEEFIALSWIGSLTHSKVNVGNSATEIADRTNLATDNASLAAIPETLLMAKAFADGMQPSKIVPYHYKASESPAKEDITIITQITANRLQAFERLVEAYDGEFVQLHEFLLGMLSFTFVVGPISVTVHVSGALHIQDNLLNRLDSLYFSHPTMSRWVDVHLVADDGFERQLNLWRNVARFFARTDYVMMLDVDFIVSPNLSEMVRQDSMVMEMLNSGDVGLVVPAFEFTDGLDAEHFPQDKQVRLPLREEAAPYTKT